MTDLCAIIGHPIGQTKSPMIQKAFAHADRLQEEARLAGAVNCLAFDGNYADGFNYDGIGLARDIVVNLGVPIKGRRVLLLGTGGAARGALGLFLAEEPAELVLAHRSPGKAEALCAAHAGDSALIAADYAALADERGAGYDIVVNAASASLFGRIPPISAKMFRPGGLAYERAYGNGLAPFPRLAKGAGVGGIADGVGMLVEQAAEAFEHWRGVRPDTKPAIKKLTVRLVRPLPGAQHPTRGKQ